MTTYADFFAALPPSSGSPRGLSHYAKIYECAYKATLPAEQRAVEVQQSGASVGVYYHALWHQRPVCAERGALTDDQAEALRLYDGYRNAFGTPEERFGLRLLGAEVELNRDFVTARLDNLYEVVEPAKLAEHGVLLPAGAKLIHDFKTAGSAYQPAYYVHGLQGRYYPAMWNAGEGCANDVAGMLFDEIVKHKELRVKRTPKGGPSFNTHWSPAPMDQAARFEELLAWCTYGDELAVRGARNRASCVDTYGQDCPLFHTCHGA